MLHIRSQIETAVAAIQQHKIARPKVGIILGTGLGGLADAIESPIMIDYAEIPHFPKSTAVGHKGRLVCGQLAGVNVVAMQGRFHQYEGYSAAEAAFPVRVMHALGAETLVVSNAAGGLNPHYEVGDIMLIEDQINFMFRNPLIGVNDDTLGPRFPDMVAPYDSNLQQTVMKIALEQNIPLRCGVYVGMMGPTYETRAEYRFVRGLGGDAVGMSTVPEVICAVHCGMRSVGFSTVTNACSPDVLTPTDGDEVVAAAGAVQEKLTTLVTELVKTIKRF